MAKKEKWNATMVVQRHYDSGLSAHYTWQLYVFKSRQACLSCVTISSNGRYSNTKEAEKSAKYTAKMFGIEIIQRAIPSD